MKRIWTNQLMLAYSLYLYFNSRSYSCASSKILTTDYNKTIVCVNLEVGTETPHVVDAFRTNKNNVKETFVVKERLIKINGQDYYYFYYYYYYWLWTASLPI
jgi:hypothetical protein